MKIGATAFFVGTSNPKFSTVFLQEHFHIFVTKCSCRNTFLAG